MTSRNLTPASGRQDHTTFAVRVSAVRQGHYHVHRIPMPHVRDDRERPSGGHGMDGNTLVIWGEKEAENFCGRGWTGDLLFCLTSRASLARCGQSREQRRVRREPARGELGEQPHALGLAGLALGEKPERAVHVQLSAWYPHQERIGISDKARQRRHSETLSH